MVLSGADGEDWRGRAIVLRGRSMISWAGAYQIGDCRGAGVRAIWDEY